MPGLTGIISNNPDDKCLLEQMANSMKHKPWQKVDKYSEPPFHIARVHLGLLDSAPQPVLNEDKTVAVFMYGNIYGYEGHLEELKVKHRFTSDSDAEFCLHAYEEYGNEFVKRFNLNGAFALAICDSSQKKLVIVNDRYGLKPLHYTVMNGHKLLFASEAKAILQDAGFKRELNEEAVADRFAYGDIYGNKTFFKRIEVIPPASVFTYKGKNVSIEQYWDFNFERDGKTSEDELIEQMVEAMRKAVEIRMQAKLRYGFSLSGGLDSRFILAAIDRERRKELVSFTWGQPGCVDARLSETVAKAAGTERIFIPLNPDDVLMPYAEQVIYFTEGIYPIHISHQAYAFEKARPHMDAYLTGLMLGELLGQSLRKGIFKVKDDAELLAWLDKQRICSNDMMRKLFHDDFYAKIKDVPPQSLENALGDKSGHPMDQFGYITQQNYARRSQFVSGNYIAENSMAVIVPAYDNNFIDLLLKTAPESRFANRLRSKLAKKLPSGLRKIPYELTLLPADAPLMLWTPAMVYQFRLKNTIRRIVWRSSRGRIYLKDGQHYAPVWEWLRVNQKWKEFTQDILFDKNACLKDLCRQEFIRTLVEEHVSGKAEHFDRINYLIALELFMRMFLAGSLSVPES
jgi:asparagine synthase (glutamine-hydrolysing)